MRTKQNDKIILFKQLKNHNIYNSILCVEFTKLINAIKKNDIELAKAIIYKTPTICEKNLIITLKNDKKNIFDLAYSNKNYEMIELLLANNFQSNTEIITGTSLIKNIFSKSNTMNYFQEKNIFKEIQLLGSFIINDGNVNDLLPLIENNQNAINILNTYYVNKNGDYLVNLLAKLNDSNNNITFLTRFLEAGGNIEQKDGFGRTAFINATINQHVKIFHLLINYKADINAKDIVGNSAITYAAFTENTYYLRVLIENKVNINTVNNDNKSPVLAAYKSFNPAALNILLNHGAKIDNINYHHLNEENLNKDQAREIKYKTCLDLLHTARKAHYFLQPWQKFKQKIPFYSPVKISNKEMLLFLTNIILTSPNEKELLKNYFTAKKNLETTKLNLNITMPTELSLKCLKTLSKKPYITLEDKQKIINIINEKPFSYLQNNITKDLIKIILERDELPPQTQGEKRKLSDILAKHSERVIKPKISEVLEPNNTNEIDDYVLEIFGNDILTGDN